MENQIPTEQINQSINESVIQPEQQPEKSNFLTILLSILLVLSLIIAGFFAFQTQKLVKELNIVKYGSGLIIPVATPDPTASWKTYTNNGYNYSLKIPETWKYNDQGMWSTMFENKLNSEESFSVTVEDDISLENYIKQSRPSTIKTSKDLDASLGTNKATRLVSQTGIIFMHEWLLTKDENIYVIKYNSSSEDDSYVQILSTFKFTN